MENYKEKYEKALKVASQWHKDGIGDVKTIVECIFPELCEREDERIRKGLIKGLSAMRDIHKHQTFSDDAINIDDAITWLEKQGEQKTLSTEETELNSLAFLTELGYTCISPKEEQNAWSEEDERMLGKCIDAASVYYSLEDKQNIKDWLRAIKDRIQPQPKQDWSEEDEKMRSSTIFFLNEFKEVYKDGAQKCITWLKSLKPHWKPSEEQLTELKNVIIGKRGPLYELYFELEKL